MLAKPLIAIQYLGVLLILAEGSSFKGQEELRTKGDRLTSPSEHHRQRLASEQPLAELSKAGDEHEQRDLAKTSQTRDEQRQEEILQLSEQKIEDLQQQQQQQRDELLVQQKEEPLQPTKTLRYEAKLQLKQEDQFFTKGQKLLDEKREESAKAPAKSLQLKIADEPKSAQVGEQHELSPTELQLQQQQFNQQVELVKEFGEQRRLEDQQHITQFQVQQQIEEQRQIGAIKGSALSSAQVAEPEPYAFDYSIEGSSRRETGDTNGVVRGQYTLQQPDGSSRIVDYIADRDGFRALVSTNEFGTESGSPANVELRSSQPAAQDISLRLEGKTRDFLTGSVPAASVATVATKGAPIVQTAIKNENWSIKGTPKAQDLSAEPEELRASKGQYRLDESLPGAKVVTQRVASQLPATQTIKGSESVQVHAETPAEQPVAKSAELRVSKSLPVEPRSAHAAIPRPRSGFQSATAHRPVMGVPRRELLFREVPSVGPLSGYHRHVAIPSVTRSYVQLQPARFDHRAQPPLPPSTAQLLRSQLQHDRYPSHPIYNPGSRVERPRVSFYSNNAESSEDLPLGFEASS